MRAITVLYALTLLIGMSVTASAQCVKVETTRAHAVTIKTPHFVPTIVYLKVDVPGGNAAAVAEKAFYQFWIDGRYPALRRDRDMNIQDVWSCRINDVQKTYVKVRALVYDERTTDRGYVLRVGVLLPESLVNRRPAAGTTLDDGTTYVGSWGEETIKGFHLPTLTLSAGD